MKKLFLLGLWGLMAGGSVHQGIEGTVYVRSGNQMPSPGRPRPVPRGIQTTLYVYELTNITQVARVGQSAYYQSIRTKLVRAVETDSLGHFRIGLPVGRYSLFTKKNGNFYASVFDMENNIAPVEVMEGKMTQVDCTMEGDRKPVY